MSTHPNRSLIVVALGGNAIVQRNERGTYEEQFENVEKTCAKIAKVIVDGRDIVLTHGNGPQIGATVLRHEMASRIAPPLPLHACGAETQGFLGYIIQQSLKSELSKRGVARTVVSIITQTVVDQNDNAFMNPTKPIGPFYTAREGEILAKERKDLSLREELGKGFRRVVPSPDPKTIVESEAIRLLVDSGTIVIASGGGGIPVVQVTQSALKGVDAVIDKDLAAEILATSLKAEELVILTDVPGVFINYQKKDEKLLTKIRTDELSHHARMGQFASGSMGPKVEAALRFVAHGGKRAVIAELQSVDKAIDGTTGTQILP